MESSRSHVVVTTLGTDRPGIVEEVSGWILEQGGNIEESRMAQLGGEFATLILVSGPAGFDRRLAESSETFQKEHSLTVLTRAVSGAPATPGVSMLRYRLTSTSLDHPGIVHQVSRLLARRSVNIVSASTDTRPAPFSATPIFQFEMEIDIPSTVSIPELRQELDALGRTDNIDLLLTPLV